MKTSYHEIEAYVTKDGSIIRELMHPRLLGQGHISLAEATIPGGATTLLHQHHQSEEVYHITAGTGILTLGSERLTVTAGDTVAIAPGIPHQVHNTHNDPLRILCCCSPAYSHADTDLLVGAASHSDHGRDLAVSETISQAVQDEEPAALARSRGAPGINPAGRARG